MSSKLVGFFKPPNEKVLERLSNLDKRFNFNKQLTLNILERVKQISRYKAILDYNGIKYIDLDINSPEFWEKAAQVDLFLFRWGQNDHEYQISHEIIPVLEKEMGVKCFPNWATYWHFDNKIRQYYLMKAHGFPMTESWIFYEKEAALDWLDTAKLPVVFKLKGGAGSRNVLLVKEKNKAELLINTMFGKGIFRGGIPDKNIVSKSHLGLQKKLRNYGVNLVKNIDALFPKVDWQIDKNYVMFQKFLPNNKFDTRVTVIGNRAFAFRRLTRDDDFRASGSGKIDFNQKDIDKNCIRLALDVSKKCGFQSMAYDFLYNEEGNPEFCEISYSYADWAVRDTPGYYDENLNFYEGHFWPNYTHLRTLLDMPELKQPELKR